MRPDISLAQTLISAVRLSGKVDRWECPNVQSGPQGVHAEVSCSVVRHGASNGTCSRYKIGAVGRGPRAEPYGWAALITLIGPLVPWLRSPLAQSIVLGGQPLLSHTHAHTKPTPTATTACLDIGCKHLGTLLHIGWGRGRILPLRIRTTVNLASAVGPSSSHLQQFQTEKRTTDDPQTIPLPTSHDLSFRTSFSFSPFGFSSVSFVTRYQPVAQSLFHTLSHQGRLSSTCHCTGAHTRNRVPSVEPSTAASRAE